MQVPIVNGIYTSSEGDFRTSYPINLVPVPKKNGISNGYLRPADGVKKVYDGKGNDRGGINWQGVHYRLSGEKLISVSQDGNITEYGTIEGSDLATFDYSFDRLSVSANGKLYYLTGGELEQVTDTDLLKVVDHVWVDGYFMTTDGEFLVVTELNDPFEVSPLKYGSSEADPDPVKALIKIRNEPHALNRYTIEAFDNIGGDGFPFARIEGAQVMRGTLSHTTCCEYLQAIAFLGSGRNEPVGVHIAGGGDSTKISTREIDQILAEYDENQLSTALVEARSQNAHDFLYIHLPDQTLVYDASGSKELGAPAWHILWGGITKTAYNARNLVWCYNEWWVGQVNGTDIGTLTFKDSYQWGESVAWQFGTPITYNESLGAIIHELELVSLSGRINTDARLSTQYSLDGIDWSMPRYIKAGRIGQRNKRLVWLSNGSMSQFRIQRFTGDSDAFLSFARLEARIEGLNT